MQVSIEQSRLAYIEFFLVGLGVKLWLTIGTLLADQVEMVSQTACDRHAVQGAKSRRDRKRFSALRTRTMNTNQQLSKIYTRRRSIMLSWALTFLVLALIAAVLGFGGIAAGAANIAQILFIVFLVLFVVSLIANAVRGRSVT